MVFWKKRWVKVLLVSLILIIGYFFTRLTNLTQMPMFTDEAIYIRWSQIGARDANWRFISLTDGKQPMFTWMMMVLLRFSPAVDPLWIGRFTSVLAGFFTLIGIWFLSWELFRSRRIAFGASFLYLISPFALMYDRMALYDSLVAAFYVWNFYLGLLLVRLRRLDVALILGLSLGAGMLNKTSGFLSLYLLPSTILLFSWRGPLKIKKMFTWLGLLIVSTILSQLIYSVLRLSPLLHMVGQKDAIFVYPFSEWINHPIRFFYGNMKGLFDWLIGYLSRPIFIASLIPLIFFWRAPAKKFLLYVWWFAPFIALGMFGRVLYPRFILFMTMPLLILAAWTLVWLWQKTARLIWWPIIVIMMFWPSLTTSYFILTNPLYAQIPQADSGQYLHDWPSGWGVKETIRFLADQSASEKINVITEGTFGLFPAAIEIYLVDSPNIQIKGIWPLPTSPSPEILDRAKAQTTYLILNESQSISPDWPVVLISQYEKGLRKDKKLRIYQIVVPDKKRT